MAWQEAGLKDRDWTETDLPAIKAHISDRRQTSNFTADAEIAETLATTDRGDSKEMRAAKLAVLKERAARMKFDREVLERQYHRTDECEAETNERIMQVRQAMQQAGSRLARMLQNVTDPAIIERTVEDEMRAVANAFADKADAAKS